MRHEGSQAKLKRNLRGRLARIQRGPSLNSDEAGADRSALSLKSALRLAEGPCTLDISRRQITNESADTSSEKNTSSAPRASALHVRAG